MSSNGEFDPDNVSRHLNLMYSRWRADASPGRADDVLCDRDEKRRYVVPDRLCTNRQHGRRQGNPEQAVRRFMANG